VLGPESAVADRGAQSRQAVGLAGIVPVMAFPTPDRGAQRGGIVRTCRPVRIATGPVAVAPVGEREVIVDADGVDVGARPQRIEMEAQIAAAVLRLMAEIFRPVGAIAEQGRAAEDRPDVGGEADALPEI